MSMVLSTLKAHSGCDRWHCEGNGQAVSGCGSYLATTSEGATLRHSLVKKGSIFFNETLWSP
jgi:hypothetical protein